MFGHRSAAVVVAGVLMLDPWVIQAQTTDQVVAEDLSAAQIVARMERHNVLRREGLKHYRAVRHYAVIYRGYFRTIEAKMDVEVTFDAYSGKKFSILSKNGSKLLREKVLERAVASELEASRIRAKTALSDVNYEFTSAGMENVSGRLAYMLDVKPRHKGKFLFRGKIWVDAVDFALVKIEAEPINNPSFWLLHTRVHHANGESGGFWLPAHVRSESKVRIGGTAVLTIDYGMYQLIPEKLPTESVR